MNPVNGNSFSHQVFFYLAFALILCLELNCDRLMTGLCVCMCLRESFLEEELVFLPGIDKTITEVSILFESFHFTVLIFLDLL